MNIAILIDAENVLPSHADLIFAHAQEMGTVIFREIYGAASALTSWVAPVLKYAIHPNLTIKAAKGKNSSDIALVIGAMDLLVAGSIDTVIIASSDSDFSSLSVRLRNAGLDVVGMGTEKANALWRTACTDFVVLQNPKPAQAAKQEASAHHEKAESAQPQERAKQQNAPRKPARSVAATHEERTAVIGQLIAKRLESHGGRLQTSTLFPTLNRLPEYQADRQNVGKKPLNYLTSTFGDVFHFEDTPDGKNWVSLNAAPEAQAPAGAEVEKPAAPEAPEAAPRLPAEAKAPAKARPEQAAPVAEAAQDASLDVAERLIAGGVAADAARQIADIFAESAGFRAAYNKLRSVFGNTAGREYYQQAKEILGA